MNIYIFEDQLSDNFLPIAYTRAVFELISGTRPILEKILSIINNKNRISLFIRPFLKDAIQKRYPSYPVNPSYIDDGLWINGRMIFTLNDIKTATQNKNTIFTVNGIPAIAYLDKSHSVKFINFENNRIKINIPENITSQEINPFVYNYFFEIPLTTGQMIIEDFNKYYTCGTIEGIIHDNVSILNKKNIYIGKNAVIKPGTVLDAEEGPIIIEKNVIIMSNSTIIGPCYIGENSVIKIGAKIYKGCHIGKVCKIGGEVESSVFQGYSNKQHDGFIGHSYVGEWVNIGADTNCSDLKNNYSNVKVWVNGKYVDSQSTFVGLTIADHSKTGINTMFNTGTVVGVGCNIYGSNFPPKYIPSFTWGGAEGFTEHKFDKMINTAKIVTSRRNVQLDRIDISLLEYIYHATREERTIFIKSNEVSS